MGHGSVAESEHGGDAASVASARRARAGLTTAQREDGKASSSSLSPQSGSLLPWSSFYFLSLLWCSSMAARPQGNCWLGHGQRRAGLMVMRKSRR